MPSLSVVIPTLNAAAGLPGCLASIAQSRRTGLVDQVVIADGGSCDETVALARAAGAVVLATPPGRGRQLAAGATLAAGNWLLFLHADTRLTLGWETAVRAFLTASDAGARAGVFRLAFDEVSRGAARTAALANWRAQHLGLPYGDQGLLIGRDLYESLGGFPDLPLMEDVALVRRLGRQRLTILDATAVTSAARYRRDGWWRRGLQNLTVLGLYFLGLPPEKLKRLYG